MRKALLILSLSTAAIVCAQQKKTSSTKQQETLQNAALQQQLLATALSSSLLNSGVRQKVTKEIGKYVLNQASSSLGKFNISKNCIKDMVNFATGLSEAKPWALQMLDSFGKLPSGILRGTVGSLGDYDLCLNVNVSNLYQKSTRFQGRYCLVGFSPSNKTHSSNVFYKTLKMGRHSRQLQPQIGICIPSTCSKDDVQNLLKTIPPTLDLDVRVKSCVASNDEIKVAPTDKLFIFFLSTLFVLVILSTLHHLFQEITQTDVKEKDEQDHGGFLHHFSLLRNAQRLFKKENNPDSIRIFHGIRVLSTLWLILSHVVIVMYDQAFGGLRTFFGFRTSFFLQLVPSSSMAVENFFFMSAVLLAYNIIKFKDYPITIKLAFQRRYIRTTIPLLFMIGLTCLLPFLGSGPLYKDIIGKEAENCKELGWLNFLYINNFIPYQKMCMVSTWYLSADTQLFLLSLFVLVPYRKQPQKLVPFIVILLILGIIGKIVSIIVFNLPPTTLMLDPEFENINYVWQRSYFSPIFHLSTYSIGMLVGYMLASNKQLNVSKMNSSIFWIFSILIQFGIVFGVYVWNSAEEPPSLITSLLYGVSHRILWSLTMAWITFSCQANDKNILSRFLGAEAFVPLSRVTYMAYLTNFNIKYLYIGTARSLLTYDSWTIFTMGITITTLTLLVSGLFTLVFESPFLSIEKAVLKKSIEKKEPKKITEEKTD